MSYQGGYCYNCGHHLGFFDKVCCICQTTNKISTTLDDLIERMMNRIRVLEDFKDEIQKK